MKARIDSDRRVWCGRDGCGNGLGRTTTRRWWPPTEVWEQAEEGGRRFWRQGRARGRKGHRERMEARGRTSLPGLEALGRGPTGVDVQCPKCRSVQHIDGVD
jgi:hypothetical protein